ELRDILQGERRPVALAKAARGQRRGQGVTVRFHGRAGHGGVEVVQKWPARGLVGPRAAVPHGQRVAVFGRDIGRFALLVQAEPRLLPVITHYSTPTPEPGPRSRVAANRSSQISASG